MLFQFSGFRNLPSGGGHPLLDGLQQARRAAAQCLPLSMQLVLLRDVGLAFPGPVDFQLHDGLRSGTADRPGCW